MGKRFEKDFTKDPESLNVENDLKLPKKSERDGKIAGIARWSFKVSTFTYSSYINCFNVEFAFRNTDKPLAVCPKLLGLRSRLQHNEK